MGFASGTGIGPFIIEREIGRGGMGVVYLARDPRLDRNVAIKSLPDHLATDPARLERFEIEARSLAQLNHPNVAGILGLEEKEGQKFLILEYVEGESLAQRLRSGSLTVDEALGICVQIAAGVEAAHEAGVIHRDLKPDNIRVTPDGDVKVLDFGLAKMTEEPTTAASDEAIHDAPTVTTPYQHSPTIPGVILGTAAYMSPEQARGQPVDKRTDIWSFGVVLYECLCGVGPFAGETANDSIAAILHMDVDHALLPASTPPMVRHLLRGCLQRDKALRYRDIGDVRLEIVNAGAGDGVLADEPRRGPARSTVIGLVLAFSLLTGAAAWFGKPAAPPTPLPVVNSEISLPEGTRMAHGFYPGLAISPDGHTIAFPYGDDPAAASRTRTIRRQGLMLRHLDQPEPVPVAGLPANAGWQPVFSPDGQWIAFSAPDGIYKVPVSGGQSIKMAPAMSATGLTWGDDDSIVAGRYIHGGLVRFPSMGGAIDTLTVVDTDANEMAHRLPHFIPGSDVLLFTVMHFGLAVKASDAWSVWALRISTRERALVVKNASDARFVNGHIVFMREGSLFAMPFDPIGLEVTGAPRQVLEGVQHSLYTDSARHNIGAGMYAISTSGTLVYSQGSVAPEMEYPVVRVDREGNETPLDIEPRSYCGLRVSPDGKQILLSRFYAPMSGIWIHDIDRGISRRQQRIELGTWSAWGPGPDRITFLDRKLDVGRLRFLTRPVGGSVDDDLEIDFPEDKVLAVGEWSRDGKYLLGVDGRRVRDLWVYTSEDGWSLLVEGDDDNAKWPALSPDGKWLAYASVESERRPEILVRPFPGPGPTVRVSRHGGTESAWSRDGSELFFLGFDAEGERWLMASAVSEVAGRLEFGLPRPLFKFEFLQMSPIRSWDVFADGDFVFLKPMTLDQSRESLFELHANKIRVVQNWASTLE